MDWGSIGVPAVRNYWVLSTKLLLCVGATLSVMLNVQAHGGTRTSMNSHQQVMQSRFPMDFREACEFYREKEFGYMGLSPNPPNYSTYNGVLFSCIREVLLCELGVSSSQDPPLTIGLRSPQKPFLLRYPGKEEDYSSWDDVVGGASYSREFATRFLKTMREFYWMNGNISLKRFIYLEPLLMIASGEKLSWFMQLRMASAFYWNIFQQSSFALWISQLHPRLHETYEGRGSTSGKELLWLMAKICNHRYSLLDTAITKWANRMTKMYGPTIQPMMQIYYGPEHPFSVYTHNVPWTR